MTGERAGQARRRAAAYALLSRLVIEKPTREFLNQLHAGLADSRAGDDEPLAGEVLELMAAIDAGCSGTPAELDLCVEHTRVWGSVSKGYGPLPPYESAVREQRLPGASSAAVAAHYESAGLEPPVEAGPPDHLATELHFMALCALREAEALEGKRTAEAIEWHERQREFLQEHLLEWVPAHCDAVASVARTRYHRAAATLIAAACRLDGAHIGTALETA